MALCNTMCVAGTSYLLATFPTRNSEKTGFGTGGLTKEEEGIIVVYIMLHFGAVADH